MKTVQNSARAARAQHGDVPFHLFKVGQIVRLKEGLGRPSQAADVYRITDTLPPGGSGSPQYRIRSDKEPHERVTTQDSLMAVA